MRRKIFFGFFYYIIAAMLVMGWRMSLAGSESVFPHECEFWLSHLAVLGIWCIIGGCNGWFRGDN